MSRWWILVVAVAWPVVASPSSPDPSLLGRAQLTAVDRASFLHSVNPRISLTQALNLSLLYDEEATVEGVNADWAFAQMLLETSYLRFGGQVSAGQNNFAGMGARDTGERGLHFSSPRLGVRAQIQLLKQYASALPLHGRPVLPDRVFFKRGAAPTVYGLARSWATDPAYGDKLVALMDRMTAYARPPSAPAS